MIELKVNSDKEIDLLKEQAKIINTELFEVKNENFELKKELKKHDIKAPVGIVKSEVAETECQVEQQKKKKKKKKKKAELNTSNINVLTDKLSKESGLIRRVSLINSGSVVHVTYEKMSIIDIQKLSNGLKSRCFDYMINEVGLNHHKSLLNELLHEVSHHLYEVTIEVVVNYYFCFPLDLKNIQDYDICIPGKFNVKVINNELLVETNEPCLITFYIENYVADVESGTKFDLKQVDKLSSEFTFTNGYGLLWWMDRMWMP